jgi:hypothetical protein
MLLVLQTTHRTPPVENVKQQQQLASFYSQQVNPINVELWRAINPRFNFAAGVVPMNSSQ